MKHLQICSNCVMDTTDSKIKFDDNGICDHCNTYYENILPKWHTDKRGHKALEEIVTKIKKEGYSIKSKVLKSVLLFF